MQSGFSRTCSVDSDFWLCCCRRSCVAVAAAWWRHSVRQSCWRHWCVPWWRHQTNQVRTLQCRPMWHDRYGICCSITDTMHAYRRTCIHSTVVDIYLEKRVCLFLSVWHSHISKTTLPNFTKLSVHVTCCMWLWFATLAADDNSGSHVLPLLYTTSCLPIMVMARDSLESRTRVEVRCLWLRRLSVRCAARNDTCVCVCVCVCTCLLFTVCYAEIVAWVRPADCLSSSPSSSPSSRRTN